jgi:hypothetical protein
MAARMIAAGSIRAGVWEVDDEQGHRLYLGEDGKLAAELVEDDPTAQLLHLPLLPELQPQMWLCVECELTAGPYLRLGEAAALAAVHDQVHHGTAETAEVFEAGPPTAVAVTS